MSNLLVQQLKKIFPAKEYGQILRAMRHDPIIWASLQSPENAGKMIEFAGSISARWTPAFLALVALEIPDKYTELKSKSSSIDERIKYRAAAEFEKITSGSKLDVSSLTLETIGMAAIALRERWIILNQADVTIFSQQPNFTAWKAISACLIGMLPEPGKFLSDLLIANSPELKALAIHAISANPDIDQILARQFSKAVYPLQTIERIDILRQTHQVNPKLAEHLANSIIDHLSKSAKRTANPFEVIQDFAEMSELLRITGQFEQAIPTLEKLWQATSSLQTDLTAQLAQDAAKANHQDTALQAIEKISQLEDHLQPVDRANVALAQIHTGQLDPKLLELSETPEVQTPANPTTLVAKAQIAYKKSDFIEAQSYAARAYELTSKFLREQDPISGTITASINPDFIQTLIDLLINLELVIEAGSLCDLSLSKLPNNDQIVFLKSKAAFLSGDLAQATEYAQVAVALSPDNNEFRRSLIDLLLKQSNWSEALREAETLIAQLEIPSAKDYQLLSTCHLRNDQIEDAVVSVKKGLALDADDDELHAQLGYILQKDKKFGEAIKHYNKAILLNPQYAEYWSSLANLYVLDSNVDKAEEVLQSAFDVIPNNSQLHLQLGQIHNQYNKPEAALTEFHSAKQYVVSETPHPIRQEIYRSLGKSLSQQGYHQEALEVLKEGSQAFPVDPSIAHLYGKALLHHGDVKEALTAFQISSQTPNPSVEVLLDHSRAMLAYGGKTEEALNKIQTALKIEPDNPMGKALLAEATAQNGEHTQAIKYFQQALLTELADQPEWQVSLSTQLAESAFALNQPEIAVTFLQETLQKVPDNLQVKQTLCQAYILTDLLKDAFRLIDDILESHSQNLEILMWAADQAILINDLEYAAEILNQAREISPQKADILVRLGYIQLENGDEQLARTTFGQLFAAENVDAKNLRLAAQALIGLGDISNSIPYLEKALELSDYKSSDLLKELTNLHLKSGNFQAALDTVNKQIKIQPLLPNLFVTQADILYQLSQPKSALNSMLKALELAPDSAKLHAKTAYLLRKNHDLAGSLYHIKQALDIKPDDPKIKLQAAQVLHACMLSEQARELVLSFATMEKPSLSTALLTAEILLEHPAEETLETASAMLEQAGELACSHPRLLALQSKFQLAQGNAEDAERLFEQALHNLAAYETGELDDLTRGTINLTISKTAISMKRWDIALFFAREAQNLIPNEPAPYMLQAAAYTLRAEELHKHEALRKNTLENRVVATHKVAQEAFLSAIKSAEAYSPDPVVVKIIARWRARGEMALFNANPVEKYDTLKENPGDFAALLASLSRLEIIPDFDITLFPEEPSVLFNRALLNSKQDPGAALALAETLVQQSPKNPEFAALYAILAEQTGQIKVALNSIELALSLCPNEPIWHSMAGSLHLNLGNPERAITHLEKALQIEPDKPAHLFSLGAAYSAANSPGNAIRVLEKATSINPLASEYWVLLALCYSRIENYPYALDSIKQTIKLTPNNLSNLLTAAEISLDADETNFASQLVDHALTIPAHDVDQIIKLSNLLVSLDRLAESITYIEQKIDLAVDPVALKIQRAILVGLRQGAKEKLELLIELAKENPQNPLIFSHLTDAYIEKKNPDEAIRAAQFALKYAGSSLNITNLTKLHFQLGALFRQSGQLDQALHQLSKALELSPNFLEAHLEIGATLTQRKEYVRALEHYQSAIEIAPRDPRPYKEAGLLLKESKDFVASEAMFRQAYALDPNDIFIQRQLATVIALALIHQPNSNRFSHGKSKDK